MDVRLLGRYYCLEVSVRSLKRAARTSSGLAERRLRAHEDSVGFGTTYRVAIPHISPTRSVNLWLIFHTSSSSKASSSAALSYKHAIGSISEHYRVFAPDWPGSGQSDKPKIEYTTDYYVRFLSRFVEVLGLEKANLVGISMGGAISLGFALRSPHRVEKLVLVDSHSLGGEVPGGMASYALVRLPLLNRLVWAALKRSRKMVEQSLRTVFFDPGAVTENIVDEVHRLVKEPGAGRAWRSWQENEIGREGLRTNYVDRLSTLAVPTLILHGAEDNYVPVSWARRVHYLIETPS